jgi:hypothetical protein
MKKTLISIHIGLMALTLIAFIIFSPFKAYNFLFCETSLIFSLGITLMVIQSNIDPAYKIPLLIGSSFIAVINYFLSLFMNNHFTNNVFLFIALILITLELIVIVGIKYVSYFT